MMKYYSETIHIKTSEGSMFHNITNQVMLAVENSGIKQGIVNVYSIHTTLAIKITENCRLMMEDCEDFFDAFIPEDIDYQHDILELRDVPPEERINGFSHVRQLLMNTSETIPLIDYEVALGKWQNIFAVELDPARNRRIIVTVMGQ